jgi:hypothetical protein
MTVSGIRGERINPNVRDSKHYLRLVEPNPVLSVVAENRGGERGRVLLSLQGSWSSHLLEDDGLSLCRLLLLPIS